VLRRDDRLDLEIDFALAAVTISGLGEPAARLSRFLPLDLSPEDAAANAIALLTTSVMSIISVKEARKIIGWTVKMMLVCFWLP
jgi:hypothetical protein